jgi:uncharacterized phage-like protein YoqJ
MGSMIWCATGHRPDKLGGYDEGIRIKLITLAHNKLDEINPENVITGMAQGWDMVIARACLEKDIPYIAAVPCQKQAASWPYRAMAEHKYLLEHAERIEMISTHCSPGCFFKRNMWMVDNSLAVLALYNGEPKGGTYNCVSYAEKKGRHILNVWDEWIQTT